MNFEFSLMGIERGMVSDGKFEIRNSKFEIGHLTATLETEAT
jgi:hypothetical protein